MPRPRLMGILNATPDSFSDGGRYLDPGAAVAHALCMVEEGADIIDVGGESTRPGSSAVPAEEQMRRVLPVIERIRDACGVTISVDTTRAEVAAEALRLGASIVNDVSAGEDDPAMLPLVAEHGCGIVLMHRVLRPAEDRYSHEHVAGPIVGDVVRAVCDGLARRREAAERAGVARESIILDPGFGFGKTVAQSEELMERLPEVCALGSRVLVGVSRKSFVGALAGIGRPDRRDDASVEAAMRCAARGASILRVHAVAPHAAALRGL